MRKNVKRSYNLKGGWLTLTHNDGARIERIQLEMPFAHEVEYYTDGALNRIEAKSISAETDWQTFLEWKVAKNLYLFSSIRAIRQSVASFVADWGKPIKTTILLFVAALLLPYALGNFVGGPEGEAILIMATANIYLSVSYFAWLATFAGMVGFLSFFAAAIFIIAGKASFSETPTIVRYGYQSLVGAGSGETKYLSAPSQGRNPVIYQLPDEMDDVFDERVQKSIIELQVGRCLLIVRFQNKFSEIWENGKMVKLGELQAMGIDVERASPASGETVEQYMHTIKDLPVWFDDLVSTKVAAQKARVLAEQAHIQKVIEQSNVVDFLPTALFLFFMFLGFGAQAQPPVSEQLRSLIGMVEYNSPATSGLMIEVQPPKQAVQQFNIPANGTVANTIEKNPALNAMEKNVAIWLLSAKVNGRQYAKLSVAPQKSVEVKRAEPVVDAQPTLPPSPDREKQMRPNTPPTDQPRRSVNMLLDSAAMVEDIEAAKQIVQGAKQQLRAYTMPVWGFLMWVFNSVIIFLLCLGGLFRYIAQTAASESAVNIYGRIIIGRWIAAIHQNAAAMLLVITWMIAIVLLIDVFLWLAYLSLPLWLMLVIWFPVLWVAEKFTNWIVPNIKVIGPGR